MSKYTKEYLTKDKIASLIDRQDRCYANPDLILIRPTINRLLYPDQNLGGATSFFIHDPFPKDLKYFIDSANALSYSRLPKVGIGITFDLQANLWRAARGTDQPTRSSVLFSPKAKETALQIISYTNSMEAKTACKAYERWIWKILITHFKEEDHAIMNTFRKCLKIRKRYDAIMAEKTGEQCKIMQNNA